ncbi:MAG: hypothetical protein WAL63_02970 [Solirubrobacteraceae bacterium]
MRWKLTVRAGPKVQRRAFGDVAAALDELEVRGRELAREAPDTAVDARFKRFEPAEQVVARLEVSGPERFVPSVRAGIDIRGDGSAKAYRGRVRREAIAEGASENAYAALRRALVDAADRRLR